MDHKLKDNLNLNVCCCIDDNYAQHCGVMLCSLLENNPNSRFTIHILVTFINDINKERLIGIADKYESKCEFYEIDSQILQGVQFRERRPLSMAAYFRILLSSVLEKSVSKVLYLDSDMVVLGNITPLFKLNLEGYALAATKDVARIPDDHRMQLSLSHGKPYFNSGVMIINLEFWRTHQSEKDLIAFSKKKRKVFCHDQDALNAVFKDNWLMLSPKWNKNYPYIFNSSFFENRLDRIDFDKNPIIVHFIDYFKPWNKIFWVGFKWNRYRNYYYKYIRLTEWKDFKSQKLRLGQYAKFGMYKFLVIFSLHSIFIENIRNFLLSLVKMLEKILSFPFLMVLKIVYMFRSTRK